MPRGHPRIRTPDNKINQLGERVRLSRDDLRLTQDELCARLADVTGGHWVADRRDIFRIENGKRMVSDLEILALANALDCDPGWLLTGDE